MTKETARLIKLRWDQDRFPAWFDAAADSERAYAALERRAKEGFAYVHVCNNPNLISLKLPKAVTVVARNNKNLTSVTAPKAVEGYENNNPKLKTRIGSLRGTYRDDD